MPLILRKDITPEITLGIWHINENIETLLTLCLPDDRREAAKFVNESRKIEWLAWHALLQTLHPGAKASYDPQGGPIPQEQLIGTALPDPQLYPALFWCSKEALYKLKRNSGIDFLQDLHINAVDPNNRTIQARAQETQHTLHYLGQGSLCCVYAWEQR